jgi:hypothetical protein
MILSRSARSALRPSTSPPSASPAKNALTPAVTAYTSTPTINVNCLIQSTWKISAAVPDAVSSSARHMTPPASAAFGRAPRGPSPCRDGGES